ncbi:hypothetical protein S83_042753 [Arachis hypogaea]|nr:putative caffeoyl-CoA O-methyltransferase [Arachis hypogaea]
MNSCKMSATRAVLTLRLLTLIKANYWNYHERLLKLIRIEGIIIYDNTLWGGNVAWKEEDVPAGKRAFREAVLCFNKAISQDSRIEIALASVGDGFTICRRRI